MAVGSVVAPFAVFNGSDGNPLNNASIYIGQPNLNPQTFPVNVFWDEAGLYPAVQPVRTIGGYFSRNGTPAKLYVNGSYSIAVYDSAGRFVYNSLHEVDVLAEELANAVDPLKGAALIGRGFQVAQNVAEAITFSKSSPSKFVFILGYYAAGDGGGGAYMVKLSGTANGGTVIAMNDGGFLHLCQSAPATLRQWGCKGDGITDDTARFLACVGFGANFHVPDGTFMVGPVGPAAVPPYPAGPLAEPNRTSASVLASGQCVTGNGPRSILSWNNPTKQAFFYMKDAVNCDVSDVSFIGGYSAMILDPTSDGSVENCGLTRCYLDGQLIGMIGGRQLAIDPTGSRICIRPYAIGCKFKNIVVHGVTMSNCQRPFVSDGDFKDCTGGFCVDYSQGTRGGIMDNIIGNNVLHGVKVESSNVAGGIDSVLASERCILTQLNISNILGIGVLINSANDRILISDSILHGVVNDSAASLICLDSVTGFSSTGQCILSNVIATATIGGCLLNGLASGTLPTIVTGCNFVGKSFCINNRITKLLLEDSVIYADPASGNCINTGIGSLNNMDGFTIRGCYLTGVNGLAEQGTATTWRNVSISDTEFNIGTYAVFAGTATGGNFSFRFSENKINRSSAISAAPVTLPVTAGAMITDNRFNIIATATPAAVATSTGTTKSRISGNISTVGFSIAAPDASTTANTNNNITDAVYLA
ncbi:polysaccharide lyase domain-containing protein [Pseudomonas chlororaphis]|uniref:oxidoreductase n=1 Tax=Pseudomonas chlororaphis TaxID=587753 RepID=UPI00117A391C|nr:oxidoreductase [Pseudomonas chlororaphis]